MGRRKAREALLLRALKGAYLDFPEGQVFAAETPDFLSETLVSDGGVA